MTRWAVLDAIPEEQRHLVLRTMVRRRYRRGAVVFDAGDLADGLHLVDKGRVVVRVTTPAGEVATLNVLGPGDCFGELALVIPDRRRTATIEALEPVETMLLSVPAFTDLVTRHPSIQGVLVQLLAGQVARLSGRVVEALYTPAETRVLRRVAELAATFGGTAPVEIPLTQEALATMAGTTRPTANKVLRQAEERGHVSLRRGRITVLDLEGLHAATA